MTKFTILFITKNRSDILDALNSCLKIKKYYSNFKIIILDGNKNNFLSQKLKLLSNKVDIEIIKQKKNGFMNACFESIKNLNNGYFTFMYDDDILSPYFGKLVKYSCTKKKQIYGYGKIYPKNKNYIFDDPKIEIVSKKKINFLKEYFYFKSKNVLPNSPITSIFSVKIIKKWQYLLKNRTNDKISNYFMMKKNIGPDLLLYLLSLELDCKYSNTVFTNSITAKFSSHKNSMSIQYGSSNLKFGYWVSKKIFLDSIYNKNLIDRKSIFIHTIKGIFILLMYLLNKKKFKNFKAKNYSSIFYDLFFKIFKKTN